jgi:hypothetical protein
MDLPHAMEHEAGDPPPGVTDLELEHAWFAYPAPVRVSSRPPPSLPPRIGDDLADAWFVPEG